MHYPITTSLPSTNNPAVKETKSSPPKTVLETPEETDRIYEEKDEESSEANTSKNPEAVDTAKFHPFKMIGILLLIGLLLLITGIGIYNAKATADSPEMSKTSMRQNHLASACNLLILGNKKKHIKMNTRAAYLIILLLMSGDIQQNPGPNSEKTETCETCQMQYKLQPNNKKNEHEVSPEKSFEWICSNPSCQPNYSLGNVTDNPVHINKYAILQNTDQQTSNVKSREKRNSQKTAKPAKERTKKLKGSKKESEEKKLLKHLTKISPSDYIGKEICRFCHKSIGKAQRAISCDLCDQWTHLPCSDMTLKTYRQQKNKVFSWVCNSCRKPEDLSQEKMDTTKLKPTELPLTNESLQQLLTKSTNTNNLLLLHYNCRSYLSKVEEIHNICLKLKPSVLCLTETWLDSSTDHGANIPDGYNIIRHDRTDEFKQKYGKTNGGGVAVLYRKEYKVRKLIPSEMEETLWIEVKAKQNITIGVVYRGSYTDLLLEGENGTILEQQLNTAAEKNNKVVVVGDFNCDTDTETPDTKTKTLKEIFDSNSMCQLINKPTRIDMEKNKATTIDHIWTAPDANLTTDTGTVEGISDHTGLYAILNTSKVKPQPQKIKFRCYKNYSQENFNEDLNNALQDSRLNELIESKHLNAATESWVKIFLDTADRHAPIREKTVNEKKQHVPWYTSELEQLLAEKSKRLQLYWLDGYLKDLKLVKVISNKITHLKRKLKRTFYRDKIEQYDGEPKKMWKVLKEIVSIDSRPQNIEPEFLSQNRANDFNHYFATVGTTIQEKLNTKAEVERSRHQPDQTRHQNTAADRDNRNPKSQTKPQTQQFSFKPESEQTIVKLIDRIKTDVAVGYDNINAKLLKESKTVIAESLTKLVNLSYETQKFPNCMKKAIVRPIHKKESTEEPSNYRPLSILPVLSKVFERSATDQLVNFLESNNILNNIQHAYRKFHSTHTCLSEITNYLYEQLDEGNYVGIASIDLSKAFDTISHKLLLQKLSKLGLGEHSINWCGSYLKERTQQTKFSNFLSNEETVTAGVPQGSILGPVLFICFTNELPYYFSNCKIMSYADDSQILVSATTCKQVKHQLEELIKTAQTWYTENSLLINATKTEVMIVNRKAPNENLQIEVTENGIRKKIQPQTSIKVLGVHLDHQLNWNTQVQAVNKKAKLAIRKLSRVNHLVPIKTGILLYNALVASHFNYADTVWGGCGMKNKNKLQRSQNTAIKSLLGWRKRDSSENALKEVNLLTLTAKREVHEGVYTYKALNGKQPEAVTRRYKQQQSLMSNRSANRKILTIPLHKTEKYKHSPLYRTITTWNSLPQEIRDADTQDSFKNSLQKYKHKASEP